MLNINNSKTNTGAKSTAITATPKKEIKSVDTQEISESPLTMASSESREEAKVSQVSETPVETKEESKKSKPRLFGRKDKKKENKEEIPSEVPIETAVEAKTNTITKADPAKPVSEKIEQVTEPETVPEKKAKKGLFGRKDKKEETKEEIPSEVPIETAVEAKTNTITKADPAKPVSEKIEQVTEPETVPEKKAKKGLFGRKDKKEETKEEIPPAVPMESATEAKTDTITEADPAEPVSETIVPVTEPESSPEKKAKKGLFAKKDKTETASAAPEKKTKKQKVKKSKRLRKSKRITSTKTSFKENKAYLSVIAAAGNIPYVKDLPFVRPKDEEPPLPPYDLKTDGPLVDPVYNEGDTVLDSYWAILGLCHISIIRNKEYEVEYRVQEPKLTKFEYTLLERLDEGIRDILILRDLNKQTDKRTILYEVMDGLIKEYRLASALKPVSVHKIRYYLERSFFGWGRIDALRCDYDLEDISCDGYGSHVFIYHRDYRDMKTSIIFENPKELDNLVASFAQKAGKHISLANPIVDATLSDGSRIQLTYTTVVSAHGSSFTIRKFKPTPFSPIELLRKGTFTSEELAFLWIAVENGKSIMVIGGTASGKTTTLNALSQFIPRLSKVVSIEDTREITLDHENWIASIVPPETPGKENKNDIQMFDLLKAAMRQRPEYILVGEVRGIESQTLFQAINTGHTTFSTMHASDVVSAINRLTNPPLDVPKATIQALDLVVAQARYYKDGAPYRRLKEVVEIVGLSETGGIEVNTVFSYNPADDDTSYSGNSKIYKDIMMSKNLSSLHMEDEIRRRIAILNAMEKQGINHYRDVGRVIWAYRTRPQLVMDNLENLSVIVNDDAITEETA
ncbi:MAG TPA: ATPase, T2SS/T4P/T4SS family [Methanocorpusculum sp.]|nr:ATPase, T2SS/T4P/T4SS family [Methanocorpusculum sp.]